MLRFLENGKALAATPAAFSLIDAVPKPIADPGTTAIWEQALDMVQSGEMALEEFVARQSAWMGKLVERCKGLQFKVSGPAPASVKKPWQKKRAPRKAQAPRRRKSAEAQA